MKVELHPEADAEFAAQVEYYEDRQPGPGERFYREVIGGLDRIANNPTEPRLRKWYRIHPKQGLDGVGKVYYIGRDVSEHSTSCTGSGRRRSWRRRRRLSKVN